MFYVYCDIDRGQHGLRVRASSSAPRPASSLGRFERDRVLVALVGPVASPPTSASKTLPIVPLASGATQTVSHQTMDISFSAHSLRAETWVELPARMHCV